MSQVADGFECWRCRDTGRVSSLKSWNGHQWWAEEPCPEAVHER